MDKDHLIKLKYVPEKQKKLNRTYVLTFSNGYVTGETENNIKFESYNNSVTADGFQRLTKRKIVVASTDRLQYTGSTSAEPDMCQLFVGCFKKSRNRIKIYPTSLIQCHPILETVADTPNDNTEEQEGQNYAEKVDELTSEFGSKSKKRAMSSRIKYKLDLTDLESSVLQALEESVVLADTTNNSEGNESKNLKETSDEVLPPRNPDATTEDEVYNLHDIISEDELKAIEPQAEVLKNGTLEDIKKWESDSLYSTFVLRHLSDNVELLSVYKAKLLVYYDYIVKFSKLRYAQLRRKDIAPEIPNPFKAAFVKKFTVPTTGANGQIHRSIPPKMKDKIMAHALILALIIEDYTIELSAFQADFNVGNPKLTKIANAVGCHIATRKIDNLPTRFAELKLPLFVPQEKPFLKKKNRN